MEALIERGVMNALLKKLLRFAGKSDQRVALVFGFDAATCRRAVLYLRTSIPHVPVWLFSTAVPEADVRQQCERVVVNSSQEHF